LGEQVVHLAPPIFLYFFKYFGDITYTYIGKLSMLSPSPPQFDVSFPEKLPKVVATGGEIFSLKFTKYRLAAGLPQTRWGS